MEIRSRPFDKVQSVVHAMLRSPKTVDDLLETLGDVIHAADPGEVLDSFLMKDPRLAWLPGERFVRIDTLYTGLTLTHRLTAEEVEQGVLIDPVGWYDPIEHIHAPGAQVPTIFVGWSGELRQLRVTGLESTIQACTPGTLCGLHVTEADVEFQPVVDEHTIDDAADLALALSAAFKSAGRGPQAPTELIDVLRHALLLDQELWQRTLPPLKEMAQTAGLDYANEQLTVTGFDWDEWRASLPLHSAATSYSLTNTERTELFAAVKHYWEWKAGDQRTVSLGSAPSAALLAESAVAQAFVTALVERGDETIDDLAAFAEIAAGAVDAVFTTGCTWIRSQAALAAGDLGTHESLLKEVLAFDQEHEAANIGVGWLEFDRSNFTEAHKRLSEGGVEDPLFPLIAHITAPARSGAGRNDPCPCWSGRKFKACHGARTFPYEDRIAVLADKATRTILKRDDSKNWWLWPAKWSDAAEEPASNRIKAADGWRDALAALDRRGLLSDILLIEGGGLEQFLSARGTLLPADELELINHWASHPRRVWQVHFPAESTGAMNLVLAHDGTVENDETVPIDLLPDHLYPDEGDLIIARPLPVGDGVWRLFGGALPIEQDRLHEAFEVLATQDLAADELAHRLINLGGLHADETDEVLYIGVVEADHSALDPWLTQHVTGDASDLTADTDQLLPGQAYGEYMVLRLGNLLAVLTDSDEKHQAVTDRLVHEMPSASLAAERGVHISVLQEEMHYTLEDPEVLNEPGAEEIVMDLLNRAMLQEAALLLITAIDEPLADVAERLT